MSNPFTSRVSADERKSIISQLTLTQCNAALQTNDLQSSVRKALEARIRRLSKAAPKASDQSNLKSEICDLKCPTCGQPYNPETHPLHTCPECESEGSTACCNPGGNNCLCRACEEDFEE